MIAGNFEPAALTATRAVCYQTQTDVYNAYVHLSVNFRSLSKCRRRLNLSANLLLAPCWDSQVSKKQDRYIKLALFDFLTSVDRKL